MKLSKINYASAVFFGAIALLMSLLYGIMLWNARELILVQSGVQVTAFQCFVQFPLIGGVFFYIMAFVVIAVYNAIARKYPIGWEIKK